MVRDSQKNMFTLSLSKFVNYFLLIFFTRSACCWLGVGHSRHESQVKLNKIGVMKDWKMLFRKGDFRWNGREGGLFPESF